MRNEINPFQNLYVTERASDIEFVNVVSPVLVKHTAKLFAPGNVIIQGTQGSGKTTLLALLKPGIRDAYSNANTDFPIPESLRNFLSAGINLTRSGILDFGKRPLILETEIEEDAFALYFSDFLNYFVCLDLLTKIRSANEGKFKASNISTSSKKFTYFAELLSQEDCWFDYLLPAKTFDNIIELMEKRIIIYRKFHQFNLNDIPNKIHSSKTSIGEPISRIARLLKESEIIDNDTHLFVRIDQLEVLLECDEVRSNLGEKYRRMINTALSTRDPNLSYKIGTRTYAWKRELRIHQAETRLEEHRDYVVLDVDRILQRRENQSISIFEHFAEDVFLRRLKYSDLVSPAEVDAHKAFFTFFGAGESKDDIAKKYCKNSPPQNALKIPDNFSKEQIQYVEEIYSLNKLDAILAIAWILQGKKTYDLKTGASNLNEASRSKYWKKERIRQALLQLAANCRQSLIWGGGEDIINVGAAGILCFLSLCQNVWDVQLRSLRENNPDTRDKNAVQRLPLAVQTLGIVSASTQWFNKIAELPGGHDRQRFVENLGAFFRERLTADRKMSYPGCTGFSLLNQDLEMNCDVAEFLRDAVDYGVLIDLPHTTKEKSKKARTKWYINPIYCPHLKIYEARIKEPYYTSASEVKEWIKATKDDRRIRPKNYPMPTNDQIPTMTQGSLLDGSGQ